MPHPYSAIVFIGRKTAVQWPQLPEKTGAAIGENPATLEEGAITDRQASEIVPMWVLTIQPQTAAARKWP